MQQLTFGQAIQIAAQHHQAGRLTEAEGIYRQVLAQQPNEPDALHLLGVIANQAGRHEAAVDLIRRAIGINPRDAAYHSNLGEALRRLGRLEEAVAAHSRAITLVKDNAEFHFNLAIALGDQGKFEAASAAYAAAIRLKPDHVQAHNNLGIALDHCGKTDDAVAAFSRAVRLNPAYADAYVNLGRALSSRGDHDHAACAARAAVEINPGMGEAHNILGLTLSAQANYDEAALEFARAIQCRPAYPEAHYNLGNVLKDQGNIDAAVESYHRAIQLQPTLTEAHSNLGAALFQKGMIDEALASHSKAMTLSPARSSSAAMGHSSPSLHSNRICALHFHPDYDAAAILREQVEWDQRHGSHDVIVHLNDRSPGRRLRVGYVSPNFSQHVVGRNLHPLFRKHDRQRFEIFCYADVIRPDGFTDAFRALSDCWRDIVRHDHDQVAREIRADQIDILVDLSLHMAHNRLPVFARKPAPVQVTFAGYPAGTGLKAMDYRLTDPYLDPPGVGDWDYIERSIRLAETFWCYDPGPAGNLGQVGPLPAFENRCITFGCLNNFCKVNEHVLDLWGQVLRQVEGSRLILLCKPGSHRPAAVDRLKNIGINAGRIEFVQPQPREKYLEYYHRIDIGLDTLPYNGHTTSLDSYWMGVPVLTLVGKTVVGRAGLSHLSNLGLTELAAFTPPQFVQIARNLASDWPRLSALRAGLRQRMLQSPLMDASRFARSVESAYEYMWEQWIADKAP